MANPMGEGHKEKAKDSETKLLIVVAMFLAGSIVVGRFITYNVERERCEALGSDIKLAQRKKEIKKEAEKQCEGMKGTTHFAPDTFFETYIVKNCTVGGDITTKDCRGSATLTITGEDEYGKQKPWRVLRRVGFVCDYDDPHQEKFHSYSPRTWKLDYFILPYIEEKKFGGGGGKKGFWQSTWDEAKQKFSTNSSLPLPRQFRKMAPLPPRRSMPMKLPRKAC